MGGLLNSDGTSPAWVDMKLRTYTSPNEYTEEPVTDIKPLTDYQKRQRDKKISRQNYEKAKKTD